MRKIFLIMLLFSISLIYAESTKKVGICIIKDLKTFHKNTVIDSLKSRFPLVTFTEIPSKSLLKTKNKDFDALIIMDRLEAWTFFNRTLKKLSRKLDATKTIYFITAGDPEWQWKKQGVITVTSASKKEQVSQVVDKLSNELKQILLNK